MRHDSNQSMAEPLASTNIQEVRQINGLQQRPWTKEVEEAH